MAIEPEATPKPDAELAKELQTVRALVDGPPMEIPAEVEQRLRRIDEKPAGSPRRRPRFWLAAAAVIVIGVGAWIGVRGWLLPPPEPRIVNLTGLRLPTGKQRAIGAVGSEDFTACPGAAVRERIDQRKAEVGAEISWELSEGQRLGAAAAFELSVAEARGIVRIGPGSSREDACYPVIKIEVRSRGSRDPEALKTAVRKLLAGTQ